MPKWDEHNRLKLLMAIIKHLDPNGLPWEELSTAMDREFSAEAIRQQFNAIKRGFGKPNTNSASTTPNKAAKPAKNTSASASVNGTTSKKGRKRKATEATLDSDDESVAPPKSERIKTEKEEAAMNGDGFGAELFKTEEDDIDLENDNLYDDDNVTA